MVIHFKGPFVHPKCFGPYQDHIRVQPGHHIWEHISWLLLRMQSWWDDLSEGKYENRPKIFSFSYTDLTQGWSGCHRGACHRRRWWASPVPPLGHRCPPPAPPPAALGTQQHRVNSWNLAAFIVTIIMFSWYNSTYSHFSAWMLW